MFKSKQLESIAKQLENIESEVTYQREQITEFAYIIAGLNGRLIDLVDNIKVKVIKKVKSDLVKPDTKKKASKKKTNQAS